MKKITLALMSSFTLATLSFSATLTNAVKNNSLVVYNSGIGLVHEERELSLKKSDTQIIYEDVAKSVHTDSINIDIAPEVTLYSQQYRFDALTQNKLLEANLGKKVEVRLLRNRNEFKIITATLLAHSGANAIVRTLEYKIITVKSVNVIFDEIPKELIIKPSLVWNIKAQKDLETTMKLDYLLSGIRFESDYVLNIAGESASLTGWISVDNRSGKSFKKTKLTVLAGNIQRKPHTYANRLQKVAMMVDSPRVQEQSFEGYHIYTIPFDVTLANNEKTQIKFLQEANLSIQRLYSAALSNPLYIRGQNTINVSQFIAFKGLDIPLPRGDVRIYSKLDKQTILVGENALGHTPKHTDIKLKTGTNFDIKVAQKVTKRSDSESWYRSTVAYSVKNSSDANKTVALLVPFNTNENSKVQTDENYTMTKGNLVTFSIDVPANTSKSFTVNYESKK